MSGLRFASTLSLFNPQSIPASTFLIVSPSKLSVCRLDSKSFKISSGLPFDICELRFSDSERLVAAAPASLGGFPWKNQSFALAAVTSQLLLSFNVKFPLDKTPPPPKERLRLGLTEASSPSITKGASSQTLSGLDNCFRTDNSLSLRILGSERKDTSISIFLSDSGSLAKIIGGRGGKFEIGMSFQLPSQG